MIRPDLIAILCGAGYELKFIPLGISADGDFKIEVRKHGDLAAFSSGCDADLELSRITAKLLGAPEWRNEVEVVS
jgi:hypothetical protein